MPNPASLPYGGFLPDRPSRWPDALSTQEFHERLPFESDTVEFKQGVGSIEDTVVAFSNTRGGVILAGVADNGTVKGCPYTPALDDKIRQAVSSAHSIAPLSIRSLSVGGRDITVVGVGQLREGFAQTGNGRVLVRVGTKRVPLIGKSADSQWHQARGARLAQ